MLVSRFKRRIILASEVRANTDDSSHTFRVPSTGILTTQQKPDLKVTGKTTLYNPYTGSSTAGLHRQDQAISFVGQRLQAEATSLYQVLKGLQKTMLRCHHRRFEQSAKKVTVVVSFYTKKTSNVMLER